MGANQMTELQLNILTLLTLYTVIFTLLGVVIFIAIKLAQRGDKK